MIIDPFFFLQPEFIKGGIKLFVLIFIGIVAISAIMLAIKIRSFNKVLFLPPNSGGEFVQRVALAYFITITVLFIFALIVL